MKIFLKPNAETFRIRALASLVAKDLGRARLEIKKSLELEPKWENIRFTRAVIDYYSSLSAAAFPARVASWPEPVDWSLVKRDDDSLVRLREAAGIFHELSKETRGEERNDRSVDTWYLACLANDPDRQGDAMQFCKEILKADQTDYRAIAWATARNFDIDLGPAKKTLGRLVKDKKALIPHIIALVGFYLSSRGGKKALKLLQDTRTIFKEHQADQMWKLLTSQALVLGGSPKAAMKLIEKSELTTGLRYTMSMVLKANAKKTGDLDAVVKYLEKSYKDTKDPGFLLECCEMMAKVKNWAYVTKRAKKLIQEIGTGDVLRFCVISAYKANNFDLCINLLDGNRDLFRQKKIPNELRRIRVLCQEALGTLPAAIAELETLVREEPTTEHLIELARLYFNEGDLMNLAIIARQLNSKHDLSAENSIQISRLIQWEDRELSISLWKKATAQGLDDSLVSQAYTLGSQLGLDRELGSLTARMMQLGSKGKGGIQIVRLKDIAKIAKEKMDHQNKLNEAYLTGVVPIHVIMDILNRPLVNIFQHFFLDNDPADRSFFLIRHGGRALLEGFPESPPEWRLNLDITAVLLAQCLGILDEVEREFSPIRVPSDLMHLLISMRDQLAHHQPTRLRAYRQVMELVERNNLDVIEEDYPENDLTDKLVGELGKDWVALFEKARASGGYTVDFLPLSKRDLSGPPLALPKDANRYIVNCRAIVEALRNQGELSRGEYSEALTVLGNEGLKDVSEVIPSRGSHLYCYGNIPEVLADANLLQVLSTNFKVHIERKELDTIVTELKEYDQRKTTISWLSRIIGRLSRGINDQTYQIIPTLATKEKETKGDVPKKDNYGSLLALVQFKAEQRDVIWVDDRHISGYLLRDGIPILGILEV